MQSLVIYCKFPIKHAVYFAVSFGLLRLKLLKAFFKFSTLNPLKNIIGNSEFYFIFYFIFKISKNEANFQFSPDQHTGQKKFNSKETKFRYQFSYLKIFQVQQRRKITQLP